MPEGQGQDETPRKQVIDQVRDQCLDSLGFVVFVGSISRDLDEKGFNKIDYRYFRSNFSFEDARASIKEFIKHYNKEVNLGGEDGLEESAEG